MPSQKPRKKCYNSNGEPTGKTYSVNKNGEMNKRGIDKIKEEGPAPGSKVPKEDKTHL